MGRPRKHVDPVPPGFEDDFVYDFEEMGENVLKELSRRLRVPELARGLPGTQLLKLAENYMKYLERKHLQDTANPDTHPVSAIEIIDQQGISLEKKHEIMGEYLDQLEREWKEASQRMAELDIELKAKTNGDPTPVP